MRRELWPRRSRLASVAFKRRWTSFSGDYPVRMSGVSSAGGEVVVSVDRHGRLVALQLAPGTTARLTCEVLELLINATLCRAVDLALGAKRSSLAG